MTRVATRFEIEADETDTSARFQAPGRFRTRADFEPVDFKGEVLEAWLRAGLFTHFGSIQKRGSAPGALVGCVLLAMGKIGTDGVVRVRFTTYESLGEVAGRGGGDLALGSEDGGGAAQVEPGARGLTRGERVVPALPLRRRL